MQAVWYWWDEGQTDPVEPTDSLLSVSFCKVVNPSDSACYSVDTLEVNNLNRGKVFLGSLFLRSQCRVSKLCVLVGMCGEGSSNIEVLAQNRPYMSLLFRKYLVLFIHRFVCLR